MKTEELAARWVAQAKPEGRCASSRYRGRAFYSYGTVIGWLADAADGSRVVLVSRHQFSSTTSAVQSQLRHAADAAGLPHFTVGRPAEDHAANLADYEAQAQEREARKATARKPEIHQESADRLRARAAAYRAAFAIA